MSQPEEVRRYWREAQRKHRRAQASNRGFKPHITRFERCSLCLDFHPVFVLGPTGAATLTLADYHSERDIQNVRRAFEVLSEGEKPDALARCVQWRMKEEGEDEEAARISCELLFEDEGARERWEQKVETDNMLQTNQEMCVRGRMEIYKESEEIAEANCTLLLNDPLYRHMPPGLMKKSIPPLDIHSDTHIGDGTPEDQMRLENIMTCFYHRIQEGDDLREAMIYCDMRAKGKLTEQEEKNYQHTIDSTFNLTQKEIRETQPSTVGSTYGLTRAELLKQLHDEKTAQKLRVLKPSTTLNLRPNDEERKALAERRRITLKRLKEAFP